MATHQRKRVGGARPREAVWRDALGGGDAIRELAVVEVARGECGDGRVHPILDAQQRVLLAAVQQPLEQGPARSVGVGVLG